LTGATQKSPSGRLQILLVGLLFVVPLIVAAWLYYDGSLRPAGRSNHGAILEPIVNLQDAVPDSPAAELWQDHWLLVYSYDGECGAECRDALYTLRQSRLMLGNDMHRLIRVFLHGELAPDRVFVDEFVAEHHPGLRIVGDEDFGELLAASRPEQLPAGGFFLVDPLGNLVMYFPPDLDPRDMVEDIQHLLDLSRIG
jgi:hypothetical protein